jgi:hypothetical protein
MQQKDYKMTQKRGNILLFPLFSLFWQSFDLFDRDPRKRIAYRFKRRFEYCLRYDHNQQISKRHCPIKSDSDENNRVNALSE